MKKLNVPGPGSYKLKSSIGDVPDYALVVGNPARIIGYVNEKGERVDSPPNKE